MQLHIATVVIQSSNTTHRGPKVQRDSSWYAASAVCRAGIVIVRQRSYCIAVAVAVAVTVAVAATRMLTG